MVPDRLRARSAVLHRPVEGVEMTGRELVELHLAEPWADGPGDLRLVGANRGRREFEPFAFFKPPVEELAEGRSDAVGPVGAVLIDEVPEGVVCGSGTAVERLAQHLVLAGHRVLAEGDPQLPYAPLDLTLRSTHESNGIPRL